MFINYDLKLNILLSNEFFTDQLHLKNDVL